MVLDRAGLQADDVEQVCCASPGLLDVRGPFGHRRPVAVDCPQQLQERRHEGAGAAGESRDGLTTGSASQAIRENAVVGRIP